MIPSADFRNVTALKNIEECEFYHDVIRDSAKNFITKLGQEYFKGKLGEDSTVSLVPFAGVVDTINMVAPTSLGSSNVTDTINSKINKSYEALGLNTNWGDAMETAADQLKSKGDDRQKFVIFFTDGVPDMSAEDLTAENLDKALKASQGLYSENNHMYSVFLNRDKADIGKMNRLVNAMNLNRPDSTKSSSYVSVVNSGTSAEDIGADLESVFDSILSNIGRWSKSTMIISLEDTISPYFTIDREKFGGTEGEDWKIETTEEGLEKITFYAELDGFTEFDELERIIPVVLKEKYRYTTAYYPTNEGDALCIYSDLAGDVVTYSITYSNITEEPVDIVITDTVPTGTRFVEASDEGTLDGDVVTWTLSQVGPGTNGSVMMTVEVT